jgi:branched-chain amino acid transport system ATP-binding protein
MTEDEVAGGRAISTGEESSPGIAAAIRARTETLSERLRARFDPALPATDYFSFPDVKSDATDYQWILQAKGLTLGYAGVPVVHGIDLEIRPGEVVALLGANGAGKTTTLLALAGVLAPMSGAVWWNGGLTHDAPHKRAREGMGYVTENRAMFTTMSARENLRVSRGDVEFALKLFPEMERLVDRPAGLLSGGEQQMLSLARALCRQPTLLLADELSLGLAPIVVSRLLDAVRATADEQGTGVLLVEQHVSKAFKVADRVYVMERGRIVLRGRTHDLKSELAAINRAYLATGTEAIGAHA